jgi:hypothetical protein
MLYNLHQSGGFACTGPACQYNALYVAHAIGIDGCKITKKMTVEQEKRTLFELNH